MGSSFENACDNSPERTPDRDDRSPPANPTDESLEDGLNDPFEELLAECIDRLEHDGPNAVDALRKSHPDRTADLDRCLTMLRDLGLLVENPSATTSQDTPRPSVSALPFAATPTSSPDAVFPASAPVRFFGDYRLIARLGSGGMGDVHLARQVSLDRLVALKILRDGLETPAAIERFRREARAVAALDHPHIVRVHEAGDDDGRPYIAMAFVAGRSLDTFYGDLARRPGRTDLLSWGCNVADALAVAHDAGVVHRDVKPSNIRITPDGEAILLDFGLALRTGDVTISEVGAFVGSPYYAAPEQVRGDRAHIGPATDIYSLGVTLYEGFTGDRPFHGATSEAVFHRIIHHRPPSLRTLVPDASRDLDAVLAKAIEKEPSHRYAGAREFMDDLAAVLDNRPVIAKPISTPTRFLRWARREPIKSGLLLVSFVTMILAVVLASRWSDIERGRTERVRREVDALVAEGFRRLDENDHRRSIASFERARSLAATRADVVGGLAFARLVAEDPQGCVSTLGTTPELVRRHPSLRWMNDWADAMTIDTRAPVPPEPQDMRYDIDFFLWGIVMLTWRHPGWETTSVDAFEKAIYYADRAEPIYFFALGRALVLADRPDRGREILDVIRHRWPDRPAVAFLEAMLALLHDPAAAIEAFDRYLASHPDSAPAWANRALALRALGRHAEAAASSETAVETQPDDAPIRYAHVRHLLQLRQFAATIDHLRRLVSTHPELRTSLAEALLRSGAIDEATEWLDAVSKTSTATDGEKDHAQKLRGTTERLRERLPRFRLVVEGDGRAESILEATRLLVVAEYVGRSTLGAEWAYRRFDDYRDEDGPAYFDWLRATTVCVVYAAFGRGDGAAPNPADRRRLSAWGRKEIARGLERIADGTAGLDDVTARRALKLLLAEPVFSIVQDETVAKKFTPGEYEIESEGWLDVAEEIEELIDELKK